MSDQALLTEIQRLQCLQVLGITVYHPRFRLPGAKASVPGPWPDAEATPPAAATAVTQGAPQRTEPVTAQPARAANVQPPATPSVPRRVEAAAGLVQNFQLVFLQVDDDLALLNQIPALARPQLQDKQLALLANLLRWLGRSVPAHTPRMFRWPLPGLEHMSAGMSAETSLLHFLEQASSERGFRFLLHLGPQAVAPASRAWQSFATHSLDEMLALPTLKREAWQALLPLHALLHAKS